MDHDGQLARLTKFEGTLYAKHKVISLINEVFGIIYIYKLINIKWDI